MPGIRRRRNVYAAVVDDDDDEGVRYCKICRKLKFELVKLVPLIPDDEDEDEGEQKMKPSDYNKWLQCPSCGNRFRKQGIQREAQIRDFVEVDDDDDTDNGYVGAVFQRGRKTRLQRYMEEREQRQTGNPRRDPDALAAIRKGLKVTNYREYQIE
jgi:hypothetical protein